MVATRNFHNRQVWLTVALFCAAGVAWGQEPAEKESAHATNRSGMGRLHQVDYGFTTANNCVAAVPHPPTVTGIDPNTRALLVPGQAITQSGGGVMHFFRDGTLTVDATAAQVNLSLNAPGDSPQTTGLVGTCSGSWTLSSGNKLATHFNCHVNITTQGVSFDLGPTNTQGFISIDGSSINLDQDDNLQIVTLMLPNGAKVVSERTCVQRFALNKVSPQPRDDDDGDR
jgi:hypothetical protein